MTEDERLKHYLQYDPLTGVFTWKVAPPRSLIQVGAIAGRKHNKGYISLCCGMKTYYAHRVAWWWVHGYWPDKPIDHINGIEDDNRISNLRLTTARLNNCNKDIHRIKPGHMVGATPKQGKWDTQFCVGKRTCHIGCFNTQEEAHSQYMKCLAAPDPKVWINEWRRSRGLKEIDWGA